MILFLYIQCIYNTRKTGKKTNRCQKINLKFFIKIYLQIENYLINCFLKSKRLINNQSKTKIDRIPVKNNNRYESITSVRGV